MKGFDVKIIVVNIRQGNRENFQPKIFPRPDRESNREYSNSIRRQRDTERLPNLIIFCLCMYEELSKFESHLYCDHTDE